MEQPCPHCGYTSDRPARFCRQCGAPLFTESDASQATTRNYAPQPAPQPAPPNYGHQSATPPHYTPYQYIQNDADEQAPETTRFYRPPVATEYPAPPAPPPKRSRTGTILLIALVCFLVIGGGISFLIVSAVRRAANSGSAPIERIGEQVRKQVEEQIAREMEKVLREAEREAERSPRNAPPAPPAPPLPPGALPASLEPYKYPGAEINQVTSALSNEIVKMTTNDDIDNVVAHYRKQLGNPIVQNHDAEGQKVIFQNSGAPSIIVIINPDQRDEDKTAINIMRSRIQLPNLNQLNR